MPVRPPLDSPAPGFDLTRHDGGTWSLAEHLGARPIVLIFHRHIH